MKEKRFFRMSSSWTVGIMIAMIATTFAITGCATSDDKSYTNPNPDTFKPKGTIQGVVVDAVTREPIVGAKVSIGTGEATTNDKGQYVISDVPATSDAANGTIWDSYTVTVDTRSSTKPVKMTDPAATGKYPEFSYRNVSLDFTSLNDSSPCPGMYDWDEDEYDVENELDNDIDCGNNSTNHDTPVDGLVANLDVEIGRLACSIKGTVYGCFNTADHATPQAADVRLESNDDSDNTGSGHYGNIINTVTTTDGTFEFNNIECGGRDFRIVAADDLNNPMLHGEENIDGPEGNNETLVLHLDQWGSEDDPAKDDAIHLCPNDDRGPRIIAVTPESGSDLAAGSSQTVVLTFHEPVKQTTFASTSVSGVGNLYDDIEVMFDGSKSGNVKYTVTWLPSGCTDDCTQLEVSFPTGTSSLYRVTLKDVNRLTDAAGNYATPGVCPVDAPTTGGWGNTEGSLVDGYGDDDCVVAFSTTGGNTPAQITDLVLKNDASLDEAGVNVGQYDWSIVSGAKTYVMYCQKVQVWGTTTQEGPFVKGTGANGIVVSGSSATVDFDILADGANDSVAFVENSEVELRYNCQVAGVNSDGVEGPLSAIAADPADDEIGPELQEDGSDLACPSTGVDPSDSGSICADGTNIDQIVLEFNEELNETSAETATNYVISGLASGTAPTVTTAEYSAADDSVTLTLSAVLDPLNLLVTRITTGANGVANTTAAGDDVQVIASGNGAAGGAGGPCLIDNGTDTVEQGDDVDTGREINAGANGVCETTADNGITPAETADTVLQAPGANGRPSGTCVVDTTPYIAAASGDDVIVGGTDGAGTGEDYIHVGANGRCETAVDASGTQVIPVGQGIANATAITGGANGMIDTETLSSDDTRVGGKVTVSNVTDVGGNAIRTTGDEYFSDGSVR